MRSVCVKTLGCKVNAYESEYIISIFLNNGYELKEEADIYVINTCTVTNESDKKSRKIIHNLRKNNPNAIIVVMGCYVQNLYNENKIEEIIEYADILIGNYNKGKILEYISEYLKTKQKVLKFFDMESCKFEDMFLYKESNHTRAFIKIEDGCNNFCSYCIIPYVRGRERSKDKETILKEVKELTLRGTKEIVLTGIHTGRYGKDKDYDLFNLLLDLIEIDDLKRIRISSIEAIELNDKIISLLSSGKIASHLHIPLQSGSDKILKLMNRRYDTKTYEEIINKIRRVNPNISITTDIIVGHPYETDEDFENTYNFAKKIGFSKIHVFPYSDRYDTPSSKMNEKVMDNAKKERCKRLLELSSELQNEYENKFIDKELEVLFETKKDEYFYGYSSNYILVKTKENIKLNEIYNIKYSK